MPDYPIHTPDEQPPTRIKQGRSESDNNDAELVAIGVEGISNRTYRSYRAAAKELAPLSQLRTFEKEDAGYVLKYVRTGDPKTIERRLAKKISEEHRKTIQEYPV